jgi:predicted metal-dependent peptidase
MSTETKTPPTDIVPNNFDKLKEAIDRIAEMTKAASGIIKKYDTYKIQLDAAGRLYRYHALFAAIMNYGKFSFSLQVPTAAVSFSLKDGKYLNFVFNPFLWESLDDNERTFVICHEMLHIAFRHGIRSQSLKDEPDYNAIVCNIAMDLCINHILCDYFGFDRRDFVNPFMSNICFIDNFEKQGIILEKNCSFEVYYRELMKPENMEKLPKDYMFDGHDMVDVSDKNGTPLSKEEQDQIRNYIENKLGKDGEGMLKDMLKSKMNPNAKNHEKSEMKEAGKAAFGEKYSIILNGKKYKRKWESIIRKWDKKMRQYIESEVDRFDRTKPRFADVLSKMKNAYLPTEVKVYDEKFKKNRIQVFFYLDSSGSCIHLKDRFFNAARTLDPKRFDVRLFSFDHAVYACKITDAEVQGGGGTAFSIIEDSIQSVIKKENMEYPKKVFVITDGYGDDVRPEKPERWDIFLTEDGSKNNFPDTVVIHELKNFE